MARQWAVQLTSQLRCRLSAVLEVHGQRFRMLFMLLYGFLMNIWAAPALLRPLDRWLDAMAQESSIIDEFEKIGYFLVGKGRVPRPSLRIVRTVSRTPTWR